MKRRVCGIICYSISAGILIASIIPYNPSAFSHDMIYFKVSRIFEQSAILTIHHELEPDWIRNTNLKEYELVESGDSLSEELSIRYRISYQQKLFFNQKKLSYFDSELSILSDVGMNISNNIAGHGISGHHDHHDISIRKNLEEIIKSLDFIESDITGFFMKVRSINNCYKDATDILRHLSVIPQTKSIEYISPENYPLKAQQLVEKTLESFKKAQFAPINSRSYYYHVNHALEYYCDFILYLQEIIFKHTTPIQRTLAGNWNSWKSLGLSVNCEMIIRSGIKH